MTGAFSNFIVQALKGEAFTIYGDGSQTRSFCFIDDLLDGFDIVMDSDVRTPVNLGNPDEFSMIELAETITDVLRAKKVFDYVPLPGDDPTQRKPDITLAKSLGWNPIWDLHYGIAKTAEYFNDTIDCI
jgi:UDP-glucuronate decarboxylase